MIYLSKPFILTGVWRLFTSTVHYILYTNYHWGWCLPSGLQAGPSHYFWVFVRFRSIWGKLQRWVSVLPQYLLLASRLLVWFLTYTIGSRQYLLYIHICYGMQSFHTAICRPKNCTCNSFPFPHIFIFFPLHITCLISQYTWEYLVLHVALHVCTMSYILMSIAPSEYKIMCQIISVNIICCNRIQSGWQTPKC